MGGNTTEEQEPGTASESTSPGASIPTSDTGACNGHSKDHGSGGGAAPAGETDPTSDSDSDSDKGAGEDHHTGAAAAAPNLNSTSESDEGASEDQIMPRPDILRRHRLSRAAQMFIVYMRMFSPVAFLKRARNCYVASVTDCSHMYASTYYQPYGGIDFMRGATVYEGDRFGGYMSPAFQTPSHSLYRGSAAFRGGPGPGPYRRSLSDYERRATPVMRRAYSDAGALPYRQSGSQLGRSSPSVTPKQRAASGRAMAMFPIEETPESFRKSDFQSADTEPPPRAEAPAAEAEAGGAQQCAESVSGTGGARQQRNRGLK